MPLRLLVYDRTCVRSGLTASWVAGAALYAALGRLDAATGASSWSEALDWLLAVRPDQPVVEIQFWGHGRWGRALIDVDVLDASALRPGHPLAGRLTELRRRLSPGALWWFRTCETFGAIPGHRFARAFAEHQGVAVAGHTYVIGPLQSGLHRLLPGAAPHWSPEEGLVEGTPTTPVRAAVSRWSAPNTLTCLHGSIPAGW